MLVLVSDTIFGVHLAATCWRDLRRWCGAGLQAEVVWRMTDGRNYVADSEIVRKVRE